MREYTRSPTSKVFPMKNPRYLALSIAALTMIGTLPSAYAAPAQLPASASTQGPPSSITDADRQDIEQNSQSTVLAETDQLIVKFKDNTAETSKDGAVASLSSESSIDTDADIVKETVGGAEVIKADSFLDKQEQEKAVAELESNPNVEYAEPDYIIAAAPAGNPGNPPNDPYFATYQWNMRAIDAPGAWSMSTGQNTIIGIADTGQTSHPDLNAKYLQGYDFISTIAHSRDGDGRDTNPNDEGDWGPNYSATSTWHGTHVAGIAAASSGNGIGVAGVAPDAKIQHARVMGKDGTTYVSDQAAGVAWSAGVSVPGVPNNPTPADVVNFSEGVLVSCPQVMQDAINKAHDRNVPVVVSAGNNGLNATNSMPANCWNAIVVGSTTANNTMAGYSNWGAMLDVLAPGGDASVPVWSTKNSGTYTQGSPSYGYLYGTSMAAPHVSGIVALMKSRNPNLTVEEIRSILQNTGSNVNGYKMVNARRAVAAVTPSFKLVGAIGEYYRTHGGASAFGAPTNNEFSTRDGGFAQNFAQNTTIYWSPFTAATPVRFNNPIGAFYAKAGFENSYGYPIAAEENLPGGAQQRFRTASRTETALVWSASTGVHTLNAKGAIYNYWRSRVATFGYPVNDERANADGSVTVTFSSGVQLKWTARAGVQQIGFTDIANNQFKKEILWLANAGITTGWSDGTFRPNASVERGAMAAFFYRMAGSPAFKAPATPTFKDVPTTHPFYKEIEWMAAQGITTGWADGTFRPSATTNRDAMAAFFYRYAGKPAVTTGTVPFKDVTQSNIFYKEILWFSQQGITTGWADGTYRPTSSVQRGAMAAFIYRYKNR